MWKRALRKEVFKMNNFEAYSWLTQPGVKMSLMRFDKHTNEALQVAIDNLLKCDEYAVEVFDHDTQEFMYQVDVLSTYDEASEYIRNNSLNDESLVYGITAIYRDDNEEEIGRQTWLFSDKIGGRFDKNAVA